MSLFENVKVGDRVTVQTNNTGRTPVLSSMEVVSVSRTLFTVRGAQKPGGPPPPECRFRKFDGNEPGKGYISAYWVRALRFTTAEDEAEIARYRMERRARLALELFGNKAKQWSAAKSAAVLAFVNEWGEKS